jgi:hypothetical protein
VRYGGMTAGLDTTGLDASSSRVCSVSAPVVWHVENRGLVVEVGNIEAAIGRMRSSYIDEDQGR